MERSKLWLSSNNMTVHFKKSIEKCALNDPSDEKLGNRTDSARGGVVNGIKQHGTRNSTLRWVVRNQPPHILDFQ